MTPVEAWDDPLGVRWCVDDGVRCWLRSPSMLSAERSLLARLGGRLEGRLDGRLEGRLVGRLPALPGVSRLVALGRVRERELSPLKSLDASPPPAF